MWGTGGDPRAAVILAGLGLQEISMSGSNIGRVKQALAAFTFDEAEKIAKTVCNMATQSEILNYINQIFKEKNLIV